MPFRLDRPHAASRASIPSQASVEQLMAHGHLALAAIVAIVLPILFVSRGQTSEWNDCFVVASRHMAAHEPIHRLGESYAYPPSMAWLSVPIGVLPLPISLFVWSLVNVAATLVTFVCGWRLVGGPALDSLPRKWAAIFGLSSFLAFRWIVSPLEHQQFDMVIAALIVGGCLSVVKKRDILGGLLIGVAASMKCTPLLFAPYLAWRGRWRAAAMVGTAAVVMNLLPDLFFPKQESGLYVADWLRVFLADIGKAAPGTWHSDICLNQSLGGLFNRFAKVGFPLSVADLQLIELTPSATRWIKWLTYGVGLTLVAITALIGGRPLRDPADERDPDAGKWLWTIEFSAILALMLLLSPMSSKAHYVVLWLPCLVIARQFIEAPTRLRATLLGLLLICGTLTTKGLTGKTIGDLTLTWGLPTWFALITLIAMWEAHRSVCRLASTLSSQQALPAAVRDESAPRPATPRSYPASASRGSA